MLVSRDAQLGVRPLAPGCGGQCNPEFDATIAPSWKRQKKRCHTKLVWELRGVVVEYSGDVSIRDMQKAAEQYTGDIRFDHLKFVIADYSRITSCVAKPSEIEAVWVLDYGAKRSNRDVRKAVVTMNVRVIDLADFYVERLGGAFPVKIFPTQVEARSWLSP
jgi:hypothetical protein